MTCPGVHRCPPLPPVDADSSQSITTVAELLGAATDACDCVARLRPAVVNGPDAPLAQLALLAWRLAHAVGLVDQTDAYRLHSRLNPELSDVFDVLLLETPAAVVAHVGQLDRSRRHALTVWAVDQITAHIRRPLAIRT